MNVVPLESEMTKAPPGQGEAAFETAKNVLIGKREKSLLVQPELELE